MRWPRRQFLGRPADGVPDRAQAGREDHGEADEEGGGGDGGGCFLGCLAKRNASVRWNGKIRFAITPYGLHQYSKRKSKHQNRAIGHAPNADPSWIRQPLSITQCNHGNSC